MERGPVMLSWQHIANAHENTARGHNVVVHEFVHKLDMRSGNANGCPPCLQASWARTGRGAGSLVERVGPAYQDFRERVILARAVWR